MSTDDARVAALRAEFRANPWEVELLAPDPVLDAILDAEAEEEASRITPTGNRLAVVTDKSRTPTALADEQIASGIQAGRRDASQDARWDYVELDRMVGPLVPGQLWLVGSLPANGKALALDTPLPTPTGWTTMGDVRPGDLLFDERGQLCRVTFATEVQRDRECYRLTFSDGATIDADAEHLWVTETTGDGNKAIRNTREIAGTLLRGFRSKRIYNHRVQIALAIDTPDSILPIPPYTLGAWLGDGTSNAAAITCTEPEILEAIRSEGMVTTLRSNTNQRAWTYGLRPIGEDKWSRRSLTALLHDSDLLAHKHIPPAYLRASREQRTELLRGLLDTDGYISPKGQCEIVSVYEELSGDIVELIRTLGFKATMTCDTAKLNGKEVGPRYRVYFWPMASDAVFRLPRKTARLPRVRTAQGARVGFRYIKSVEPIPSVPVRCIQVDSPSHLYLASRSFIPTHNTTLLFSQLTAMAGMGLPTVYLPLEMDPADLRRKLAAWQCNLDSELVLQNAWDQLPPDARDRHEAALRRQTATPIHFPPDRRVTLAGLATWLRWGVDHVGAKLLVIDHFHRMDFGGTGSNYRVLVTDAIRAMKDLAREYNVPIVATCQLNGSADPFDRYQPPHLNRLKESSALGEEADVVLMLSRMLRNSLTREDLDAVKHGRVSARYFAKADVMQVMCRKHRYADSRAGDRSVLLSVGNGMVKNYTQGDEP